MLISALPTFGKTLATTVTKTGGLIPFPVSPVVYTASSVGSNAPHVGDNRPQVGVNASLVGDNASPVVTNAPQVVANAPCVVNNGAQGMPKNTEFLYNSYISLTQKLKNHVRFC